MTIKSEAQIVNTIEALKGKVPFSLEIINLVSNRRNSVVFKVRIGSSYYSLKLGFKDSSISQGEYSAFDILSRESEILQNISFLKEKYYIDSGSIEELGVAYLFTLWIEGVPFLNEIRILKENNFEIKNKINAITRSLFKQLFSLHEEGWLHGDIQPDHIFMNQEQLILIDFGMAQGKETKVKIPYRGGLVHFNAPEICEQILKNGYATPTIQSEIFSVASVIFYAISGTLLPEYPKDLAELEWEELLETISKSHFKSLYLIKDLITPQLFNVLELCLNSIPNNRPLSANDLVEILNNA